MILNPVLPLWILALVAVVFGGFVVWRLVVVRRDRAAVLRWAGRLLMVALLIAIAARPTIPQDGQGPTASGGLEVYVVVDTTSSMAAEDWADGLPRLDGVKADLETIVGSLEGAQFSLVTFDAVAVQRVPLTSDATAMGSAISVLQPEVTAYSRGSTIDEPVGSLLELLTAAQILNPDQRRVLFYVGDGEQTSGSAPGGFEALAPLIQGGAVLGYGTAEGGRMRENYWEDPTQFGDTGATAPTPEAQAPTYIQDPTTGADAVSRIDEAALQAVADQLGVPYLPRSAGSSVAGALDGIEVGAVTVTDGQPDSSVELYWVLAIPFGLLVLVELFSIALVVPELRSSRRTP